jgi:DNA mismatch endonuclease (patch repair protein)
MADVLTPQQRQLNMSRIRSGNTKPELVIRQGLHAKGMRFRLHARSLPGRPDIVFPRYRTVVLVHGCFWHGHNCDLFRMPATRVKFWSEKIAANKALDHRTVEALLAQGWRVLVVWECVLKGWGRQPLTLVISKCIRFIVGRRQYAELASYGLNTKQASRNYANKAK